MNGAFKIVEQFEHSVAEYVGAPYAVAVSTGTMALFLSLQFRKFCRYGIAKSVSIPAHTFVSVPMAAIQCGYKIALIDKKWHGTYEIEPLNIWDSALRFHQGMFHDAGYTPDALECLSFQARKIINIGEGGMILTGDKLAVDWLRAARYWGRKAPNYRVEDISMMGWQAYMTPEKAARGLHLMEYIGVGEPNLQVDYPDLRPVFDRIGYQ